MITIIDYGMGNTGSIKNMLSKLGVESIITSSTEEIGLASKLILPGVGAFDQAMESLDRLKIIPVINQKVLEEKTPILGICLGMQLLSKSSEEGVLSGLGWIDAQTVKFRLEPDAKLKIPHMGWNSIEVVKNSTIFQGLPEEPRYYFVHSYHVTCNDPNDVLATATHGIKFVASISKGNILATQFHPEKSHRFGMPILKNFTGVQ